MQENLQLKAGCLRNVVIYGQKFKNIRVYEGGGRDYEVLFNVRIHYQKAKVPWDLAFFVILLSF